MQIESTTRRTAEDLAQFRLAFSDKVNVDESQSVRSWLLPEGIDTQTSFEAAQNLRHPFTGKWFLNSNTFRDWLSQEGGCIWVYGIRKYLNSCC
jgi:hypothetical protein